AIRHPDGLQRAPRVQFQLVPEKKSVKNRVHLDVRIGTYDFEATFDKLVARGAQFIHRGQQGPNASVTLADPEESEFCVTASWSGTSVIMSPHSHVKPECPVTRLSAGRTILGRKRCAPSGRGRTRLPRAGRLRPGRRDGHRSAGR